MSFSVVIPSKNAANLVPCVRAIREAGETCRIIVVDDGLEDGAGWRERVNFAEFLPFKFVLGVKPFIFARNVNLGIQAAGEDDVLILNDDALLKTPLGFSYMANVASYKTEGLISATCNNVGNPNQWPRKGIDKTSDHLRIEKRMVCFVCVYIPRSTINTVGLLDERFTAYGYEDDDYCLRVRRAGLKIGVFDGCYVDHGSLTSTFRGHPAAGGNLTTGEAIFRDKWGAGNHDL